MSKPLKTRSVSTPDRKGVFGQGGKALRVDLYARVSTHDQKTLPLQLSAMRDYAEKRGWAVAVEVQDVGSGATTRPQRETLIEASRRREIAKRLGVSRTPQSPACYGLRSTLSALTCDFDPWRSDPKRGALLTPTL